jgi:exonuclease III
MKTRFVTAPALVLGLMVTAVPAQPLSPSFKVGFYNIQSGKGERGLRKGPVVFSDNTNCKDQSKPLNAWGIGFVQKHLVDSVGSDPDIIALGLAESWASVCASPENVRKVLGWKARSSERNGVALVAKHGFDGPEEWVQLDTTLNTNKADTMWVLRRPVCLDEPCSRSIDVFVSHWFGSGPNKNPSYDRQAAQTVAFLKRAGGSRPHILIGDLNVFDGSARVCRQTPNNIGLDRLREAGYVDAWPLLHGDAEGFTGMNNRRGCGTPEGYVWKRPDYTWSPATFKPVSMVRFGMAANPGEATPSDHLGIITEFPRIR